MGKVVQCDGQKDIVVRDEVLLLTQLKLLLLQIIQLNIRNTGTACLLGVFSYF